MSNNNVVEIYWLLNDLYDRKTNNSGKNWWERIMDSNMMIDHFYCNLCNKAISATLKLNSSFSKFHSLDEHALQHLKEYNLSFFILLYSDITSEVKKFTFLDNGAA